MGTLNQQSKLLTFLYAAVLTMEVNVAQAQSTPAKVSSDIADKELSLPDVEKGRISNSTGVLSMRFGQGPNKQNEGSITFDFGDRYVGGKIDDSDYDKKIRIEKVLSFGLKGNLNVRTNNNQGDAQLDYLHFTSPNIGLLAIKQMYKTPLGSLNKKQLDKEKKAGEAFIEEIGNLTEEEAKFYNLTNLKELPISEMKLYLTNFNRQLKDEKVDKIKKRFSSAHRKIKNYFNTYMKDQKINLKKLLSDEENFKRAFPNKKTRSLMIDAFRSSDDSYGGHQYKDFAYKSQTAEEILSYFNDHRDMKISDEEVNFSQRVRELEDGYKVVMKNSSQKYHHAAIGAQAITVQYDYINNKLLGMELNSVLIDFLKVNGHVSFQLKNSDIIFDLCAEANGTLRVSKYKSVNYEKSVLILGVEARACAGVQLGSIGHLSNDFKVSYQNAERFDHPTLEGENVNLSYLEIEDTTRFSNVMGTGLGLFYKYKSESLKEDFGINNKVNTHIFGASFDI